MNEDVDVDYEWEEFYDNNKTIPPHASRLSSLNENIKSYPFCLKLKYFEIPYRSQSSSKFQVRLTFYDAANHCYFGSTWIGSIIESNVITSGLHSVQVNEPLYFQCNVNDYTVCLLFEIVSADGDLETLAWSFLRLFSQFESLSDTEETVRPQEKRLEFYYGSVCALLRIEEPIEEMSLLNKVGGCFLVYSLQTHEALESVSHVVPHNVVVNGDDIIPGIVEEGEEENGIVDILKSPSLLKTWPCHFNKLAVHLHPSVDKFEDHLCNLINRERLMKDSIQPDGNTVNILERKLKIGVHNGWQFVRPPHTVYLEREYSDVPASTTPRKPTNRPPSGMSTLTRDCQYLVLRSRLELSEMVKHPLFAVVFQLEYVVNVPVSQPELPTNKKARTKLGASFGSMPLSQKISLAIRLTTWVPFQDGNCKNKNISLPLSGGVTTNPYGDILFTEAFNVTSNMNLQDSGKIEFIFTQLRLKKSEGSILRPQSKVTDKSITNTFSPSSSPLVVGSPVIGPVTDVSHMTSFSAKPPLPTQQRTPTATDVEAQESQYLTELPRSQVYSSLIVSPVEANKVVALSRVAHSILHTVEFPKIEDRDGKPPFIINPEEEIRYDITRETRDPLHANEIVIQFLAVSGCCYKSVFFTFQFYRFPQTTTERLHLKFLEGADRIKGHVPCILRKTARDGSPSDNLLPGLTVRYTVDPSFMQAGENLSFLKYLHQQRLYIDMWDGDSLLLVGSTSIALKYLLRQGNPAVQVSQELDIIYSECSEGDSKLSDDLLLTQGPNPTGVKVSVEGKLFIRLANIGSLPDTNPDKLKEIMSSLHSTVVTPKNISKINMSSIESFKTSQKSTAKLLSDCDTELATVLLTRKDRPGKTEAMKTKEVNNTRRRKMDRMQAVRQLKGGEEISSSYIVQKEEKIQRTRDLRTIQFYRDKVKTLNISSRLEDNITTHHMLHSSLGRAEFFEYALQNPYPNDQVVVINTDDTELCVITNPKEWRYYKMATNTNTAMEDQMFTSSNEYGAKIFIRANETVHIPFKFQSFTSHSVSPEIGPSHPLYTKTSHYSLQTFGKDTTLSSKEIKILFSGNDNRPLSILILHVELHPHAIDQTFRFYHPEQSFLKKAIRLPPWQSLPGSSVIENGVYPNVVSRCTDDSAICETHQVKAGEPQEVFIKTPCGLSPTVKRFFIVLYIDEYCSKPCQIWQLYVHSLQRIDISAVEGQMSKYSLLLKGTQSSRMVKCFSSHPDELKLAPTDSFMLIANGVQELVLSLNPLESGKRMMFINVVDQEFHQLVKSWLIMTSCSPPEITKSFELRLKVGGAAGSNKKISFMNPYPVKKNFYLKTNRPDLLKFKEEGLMLGGGESHNIGLSFLPQQVEGSAVILIFINDRDGKNEETFSVKINYAL